MNLTEAWKLLELKERMKSAVEAPFLLYKSKLDIISKEIIKLTKKHFDFSDIYTDKFIMDLKDDYLSIMGLTNKKSKMNIPKDNLIHDGDNENLYIERLTDEIIRYDNIRMFIFDPNMYLSMIQQNYDLNNDEVLVPQSILDKDYFENMVPDIKNSYGDYNTYDEVSTRDKRKNNIFAYEEPVIVKKKNKIVLGNQNEENEEGHAEEKEETGGIEVTKKKGKKTKLGKKEELEENEADKEEDEEGDEEGQSGGYGDPNIEIINKIIACNINDPSLNLMDTDDEINSLYDENNDGSNKQTIIQNANYLRDILNGILKNEQKIISQIKILKNSKQECKKIGAESFDMIKLKYTNPKDSSEFPFYWPYDRRNIFNQQTGGAELETTGKFKPYGLKIKIGETGDFPSSKLKTKRFTPCRPLS